MLLALIAFVAGVAAAPAVRVTVTGTSQTTEASNVVQQFEVFWQVWNLVSSNYVDRSKVNANVMTTGAIRGMLNTLDDPGHTRYLTQAEYISQENSLQGRFTGIGVSIEQRESSIVIQQVYPQSPAADAGVQLGDTILAINGKSTEGMSVGDASTLIRGPEGTTLTLDVRHAGGQASQTLTLTRKAIHLTSVEWQMLPDTQVADVAITSFSDGTAASLREALTAAKSRGATGYIVDVRDNPGGLLDESVAVTSLFLSTGTVLYQRDANGNETRYGVQSGAVDTTNPVVVLVNHNTASAAEIFAAAIRDNHRGQLIGTTTLGTGTVLSTYRLVDGSALLLGTLEWLTPDKQSLWRNGVTPTIAVTPPANTTMFRPETLEFPITPATVWGTQDPILAKGLEVLETAQAAK